MANIIDGREIAKRIREELKRETAAMAQKPGLSVILVGNDPASATYVGMKEKACKAAGIESRVYRLSEDTSQAELMSLVAELNNDDAVHGILVQLPLPKHLDQNAIFGAVKVEKDVDGFHPMNVGLMTLGLPGAWEPCTPAGVMEMLSATGIDVTGKHAVVVGNSNVVGKPMSTLLALAGATVTTCHRQTVDLAKHTREADILVVAVGKVNLVTADMIKPGAVVIDVGTNKVGDKLVGDVEYDKALEVASYITPVPGGVGPMTIALLLKNTVRAAQEKNG